MSLGLVAPLALGLLALLVGPVLAHLTRRLVRREAPFGAMMLLERMQRRTRRQRRLSDLLLLLARALLVGMLVVAAARPELRWSQVTTTLGASGRVVVVLDTSMSMDQRVGGESAFEQARAAAIEEVRGLPDGAAVALVVAGAPAVLRTAGMVTDHELVASLLQEEELGRVATDLPGALVIARTLLGEQPGEVVVYSDEAGPEFAERCRLDVEKLLSFGSVVVPRTFAPDVPRNLYVADAVYGDGVEGGTVTVGLVNVGPDRIEVPTSVWLPDGTRLTSFVQAAGSVDGLPARTEVRFTVPRQTQGGVARVELEDPDLPADNTRWFHLPSVGASRVLIVDGDPGSSPTRSEVYFLERALAPWGAGGIAVDVVSPSGVGTLDPSRHRVAWVANVADPAAVAPRLVEFVREGGGLVLGLGENVTADRYNLALASLLPASLRRVSDLVTEGGEPLASPDVGRVELFRPFARVPGATFAAVRSRRVWTFDPYAESDEVATLLRYQSGLPALVQRQVGSGRVLVWTGTFDLGWGNLPLQAVFAPFVQRLTSWLGGDVMAGLETLDAVVGSPVEVSLPGGAADVALTGPGGGIVSSERQGRALRFTPGEPGAFEARTQDGPPLLSIAVNTPPEESDVRTGPGLLAMEAELRPEVTSARRPLLDLAFALAGLGALAAAVLAGRRTGEGAAEKLEEAA